MVRKLCLSSLLLRFKGISRSLNSPSSTSWLWPSCKHPRTLSFRTDGNGEIYKTVNSIYLDSAESCFTFSEEEEESFSTTSASDDYKGLRSDRLFFEPGDLSSSIMDEARASEVCPLKETFVLALESEDPYRDIRVSMEEMVVAHELNDWLSLQDLLVWYLRANGKKIHGFIFGAFVDLLVNLDSPSTSSSSHSMCLRIQEVEDGSDSVSVSS